MKLVTEANIYADNVEYSSETINKKAKNTVANFILNIIMENNELIKYIN